MPPGIYGSNTAYGTESISGSSSRSNSRKAGYDDSMPTTSGGVCSKKITTDITNKITCILVETIPHLPSQADAVLLTIYKQSIMIHILIC